MPRRLFRALVLSAESGSGPRGGRRPTHPLVLCMLLATILTACGGGSESPAVGEHFAAQARMVCRDALAMKKAQGPFPYPDFNPTKPDRSKLLGVARFLEKTINTFQTWLRDMEALGQPPTGRKAWTDLLRAIQTHVRLDIEQQAAAWRGDTETFINDYVEGVQSQEALLSAAESAGVPQCAAVDR